MDCSRINCFDLEMCCWEDSKLTGEIISIGIVDLCLKTGKIRKEGHYYVRPDHDEVSAYCTELTGITRRHIEKQGRPLGAVMDSVRAQFGGAQRIYTAWGTDAEVVRKESIVKGFDSPIINSVNAALMYNLKKRHSGRPRGMLKAMADNGLVFEGRQHNALVDSRNLAGLIVASKLFG